jgi:hypothetical protein
MSFETRGLHDVHISLYLMQFQYKIPVTHRFLILINHANAGTTVFGRPCRNFFTDVFSVLVN